MRTGILWCVLISGIGFMLAGCTGVSPSPQYYLLESPANMALVNPPVSPPLENLSLGIGPVLIPGYLDRPQIVTRTGQNTLDVNPFHRWGESLERQFRRQLAMNLSTLLRTPHVVFYPWKGSVGPGYQVIVTVFRFEQGKAGAEFDTAWQVVDVAGDRSVMSRRFSVTIPVESPAVNAYVEAQSKALEAFSREIAKGIIDLVQDSRTSAYHPPGD